MEIVQAIKELTVLLVALISALSAVLVAYITKRFDKKIKLIEIERDKERREKKRTKLELSMLTLFIRYDAYEMIDEQISYLKEHTSLSRFLILFAINGKKDFNTVTVIYEDTRGKQSKGAMKRYVRLPIDSHYRNMLKETEKRGFVNINIEDLPEKSLLRSIYEREDEQVKHSKIIFLDRLHVDEDNDLLLFASAGTHENKEFTPKEKHLIRIATNSIRHNIKIQLNENFDMV